MALIALTGRLPALSIAELEAIFGANAVSPLPPYAARVEYNDDIQIFDRIGGTQKVGKILTNINGTDWNTLSGYVKKTLPEHLGYIPEGKITFGMSVYGIKAEPRILNATALEIKKIIKRSGRSVRVVPNKNLELNAAQVLHNKLTSPNGMELLFIKDGKRTILAQTVWIQDIDAYAARDQARPMRDARVGMLPPKLAQTIINFAGNHVLSNGRRPSKEQIEQSMKLNPHLRAAVLLDPFCGTGVLLQEAYVLGYNIVGSDIDARMIEYTGKNLAWIENKLKRPMASPRLTVADATSYTWEQPFDFLACETYLGRPLSSPPDKETLRQIMNDCNTIHKKFLQNVARQTKKDFRMCIAVPAWKTKQGFEHLQVLDHLKELGYNRLSFVHAKTEDLIYHRKGQIVARELVVLIRK